MKEEQQSFSFEATSKLEKTAGKINTKVRSAARKDTPKAEGAPDDRRFMRRREVEAITGWSRSTLYRQIAAKAFPAPVKLSSNTVGFIAAEVFAWMNDRIKCRASTMTANESS